jgi:hypothetical protein
METLTIVHGRTMKTILRIALRSQLFPEYIRARLHCLHDGIAEGNDIQLPVTPGDVLLIHSAVVFARKASDALQCDHPLDKRYRQAQQTLACVEEEIVAQIKLVWPHLTDRLFGSK